jgi:pilus assembly protein CpaE
VTILCEADPEAVALLAQPLASDGVAVHTVPDLSAAALAIEADPSENLVVIGNAAPVEDVVQFTEYLRAQRPAAGVILLRESYEASTVAAMVRAGVREVIPDTPAALSDAYCRVRAACVTVPHVEDPLTERTALADELLGPRAVVGLEKQPQVPTLVERRKGRGQIITVFSPKGGTGKTTISTNLAVALNKAGHTVCLVDLDLEFGDVAISLRLTPVRTLVDAVTAERAPDEDEISQLIVRFADGLDTILAPVEPGEAEKIPASLVAHILDALRNRYEFTVIDTPSQFSEHVLAALDASDHHILLTNPEMPALKNLRLTLDMFDLLGYDRARRAVVFNRADDSVGLSADDVQAALKAPIAAHIPASRDVPASINRGVPIVSAKPDHPVSAAIRRFAADLIKGQSPEPSNRSGRRARFLRRRAG